MFERVLYLGVFFLYTALCGVLLVSYDANALVVALVLSIAPALLLWQIEHLHARMLPVLTVIVIAVTLLLEVLAYTNGLWYEISPWEIRLFGLVPLEAIIASFAHVLLYIVAYEFWFDDRKASRTQPPHLSYGLAISSGFVALALAYLYVFSGVLFTYPYAVLIMFIFLAFFIGIALAHRDFWSVIKKAAVFALCIFPISLVYEYVVLSNELRFLANSNEYLYSLAFFGQRLPIEELLLIFMVPFWVAVLYELYLDDAR